MRFNLDIGRFTSMGSRLVLAAGLSLASMSGHAALLGLTLADTPDIDNQFISSNYDASGAQLDANGFALVIATDLGNFDITGGTFNLSAAIDNSGAFGGGTVTINGTVGALGFTSGVLLTGTLTDFGFSSSGADLLEFTFDVTGGDASVLYSPSERGGIIMTFAGFRGDFSSDFSSFTASADVGAVPVPAAVWLFGSGLLLLTGLRRRA